MADRRARIALLIDADNARAQDIDAILTELSKYGETNIRRAYGNWDRPQLGSWKEVLHPRAIRPMQQYDYSRGKNASDMALVVDAMAMLYTDAPDAFGIVSSDADFTPLVQHLRERGVAVYGFGAQKTPEPFVSACTRFLYVDQLSDDDEETDDPTEVPPRKRRTTEELQQDTHLVRFLRSAVAAAADDDGWARVSAVGSQIANQSSFDPRNHGYASLTKLLAATELFEMRDEGSSDVSVRDRRVAPQRKTAQKKTARKATKKAPAKKAT